MGEIYRERYAGRRDLAIEDLPLSRSAHGPQPAFEEADESSEPGIIAGHPRQSAGKQAAFC